MASSWWSSWKDPWTKGNDPWSQGSSSGTSSSQPKATEVEHLPVELKEAKDVKMGDEPVVLKSADEVTDEPRKKRNYCDKSSSTVVAECGSDTAEIEGREVWEDVVMKEKPPRVPDHPQPKYSKTDEEMELHCKICQLTLKGRSQYVAHFQWGNTFIA